MTFTPHDFRRLCATEIVNGGLPIHIGAALLGHLNLQTLQGYVAVFAEDIVANYQRFLNHRRSLRPEIEYPEGDGPRRALPRTYNPGRAAETALDLKAVARWAEGRFHPVREQQVLLAPVDGPSAWAQARPALEDLAGLLPRPGLLGWCGVPVVSLGEAG